jgi:O-antigen/teichoic acid export membrane protein
MQLSALKKIVGTQAFKDASVLGFAHALTLLIGLATTVAWTRWMPMEMYGQFKVVMGVISFASAFCLIGVGQVALMSASSHADGNLVSLIRSKLLANLGGATLILCVAAYYFWIRENSVALAAGLVAAALLFPIYNSNDVWAGWLNGKGQFASLAVGRLLVSGLALVTVFLMVLIHDGSLWLAIAILLVLVSVQNSLMLKKALDHRKNKDGDNELMRFGRHATVAMMFTSILALDVVFLENFHDAEEVALYAVALVLPGLLKTLFGIVSQVVAPKIYATDSPREIWQSYKGKFIRLTIVFIVLGIVGFFLIPNLVPLLFTEQYSAAGDYAKWLWLVISCTGSLSYMGLALLATKRVIYVYMPNVGAPLIMILLWLFCIDYGVAGMIFARCFQAILLSSYYVVAFYNYLGRSSA